MVDVIKGVGLEMTGYNTLLKKLSKYSDPEEHFDDAVYDAVNEARDLLQEATPNPKKNNHTVWDTSTGYTRRQWQEIKKVRNSFYTIDNTATTKDKKHAIVDLIRSGRGVVRPKKAKKLWIPINRQTADKARKNIYDNIEYGKDYILADKAGPVPPHDFVTPVTEKVQTQIAKNVMAQIRKEVK